MKNFLRVLMFLIIAVAIVGTTIFLTNQNSNYIEKEPELSTSGESEILDNLITSGDENEDVFDSELVSSGETVTESESGDVAENSGDETEIVEENVSGETIEEISNEVSGDISGDYKEEEQAA